jgi:DNA-directed RNA polymerase specialized sigma24 family protein
MDEVEEFCLRVLGSPEAAADAAARARAEAGEERIARLSAAVRECRERADVREGGVPEAASRVGGGSSGLAAAVARELADSTARLPERQREVLALRELLRLSYEQISRVMSIDQAAVASLLARARLGLRAERRGWSAQDGECEHRDRALRVLASRQDSEPISVEDDGWVLAHMAACAPCETAHAAMLEASVCYRAWPRE